MSTAQDVDTQMVEAVGYVAAEEYLKAPGYQRAGMRQWWEKLLKMTDEQFQAECEVWCREGVISESQRGTDPRVYFRVYACTKEGKNRYEREGHTKECPELSLYQRALDEVRSQFGFGDDLSASPCDCGRPGAK